LKKYWVLTCDDSCSGDEASAAVEAAVHQQTRVPRMLFVVDSDAVVDEILVAPASFAPDERAECRSFQTAAGETQVANEIYETWKQPTVQILII